jgi:hypothetical protein
MSDADEVLQRLFEDLGRRKGARIQILEGNSAEEVFDKLLEAFGSDKDRVVSAEEFLGYWSPDDALAQAVQANAGAQKCFTTGCEDESCYGFKADMADRWLEISRQLTLRQVRKQTSVEPSANLGLARTLELLSELRTRFEVTTPNDEALDAVLRLLQILDAETLDYRVSGNEE